MGTSRLVTLVLMATACGSAQVAPAAPEPPAAEAPAAQAPSTVVLASEVEWQPLNPARGDASPMAATLFGDRNGPGPTGFLVRFVDGFSSPPHIHNVAYRGVVIGGLVHNGGSDADEMWMPAGSFWTQPRGAVHITAARGSDTLAYIEIDEGPYLVRPVEEASPSGERALNVEAPNIAWVDSSRGDRSEVAVLWGDPLDDQPSGVLVKLPAGSTALLPSHGRAFGAVVIQGQPGNRARGETGVTALEPGSYFSSDSGPIQLSCEPTENCVIYLRITGPVPRP